MQKRRLDNGLTLITEKVPGSKSVAICITAKVGSNYENDDNNGVSHFLEHLMLDGTKNRPSSRDVASDIDKLGGILNAETDKDYTSFYVLILKKWFDVALDVLSDVIQNPLFDQKEILKERKVILEEYYQMLLDNPSHFAHELFEGALYENSPAARMVIGTEDTIKNMSKDAVSDYYKTFYAPQNIIVSVVGDIDHDEVEKKVSVAFANFESKELKRPTLLNEPQTTTKSMKKEIAQAHLVLGVPGAKLAQDDDLVLDVIQAYLSGGISSRLLQEIREKKGLAYDVSASNEAYASYGYFMARIATTSKNLAEAKELIINELFKLADEKISEKSLEDAKNFVEGNFLLHLENNMIRAKLINTYELVGKAEFIEEYTSRIKQITTDDVLRVSKKYFSKDKMTVVTLEPTK